MRRIHAFRDDPLGTLDAVGLAERIARGEVTAADVIKAAIERAEAVDPQLNAIVARTFEQALAQDVRPESAASEHVFAGVPTFIKDTDDLRGVPTRMGSRAMPIHIAADHSPFVHQLLSTGLVPLGKSNLPEFGLTATTEPLAHGPARNPWNLEHSTGGSSGGSAALVAAGVVPIAHANDGGGSIRIPASCCGLVGLKPSHGRLAGFAQEERAPVKLAVHGVLTRSVRDTATFLAAAERFRRAPALPATGQVEGPSRERLRIAFFSDAADGRKSHPEVAAAVEDAARRLADLGHRVEPIACPFPQDVLEDFLVYWGFGPAMYRLLGRRLLGREFDRDRLEDWANGLARLFRRNLWRAPAIVRRLRRFKRQYPECFAAHDVLLCPTLAEPPAPIGHLGPAVPFETAYERIRRYVPFTPVQNAAGAPAISLPLGRSTAGLPIGVQLAARVGEERRLLELAFELEQACPWPSLFQN